MQNDKFGRLLKGAINSIAAYERKTALIIEDELGQQIGVSAASIQRYKAGHIPPEPTTVRVLAEMALKRGYLNREWLQNFLQAAQYPTPEKLLAQLYPAELAQAIPPPLALRQPATRVYHNLPAPTYSQFVEREGAAADVRDGLNQRSAAVVIISLGGMGKTSLAREVAAACLQGSSPDLPRFEAIVWVSDKDRPGTTTLGTVLDEVARVLDYPGFTQFESQEKQREVEQLLRRQRVLLVLDNFETVGDDKLLTWLLRLPEPSKALITTREYQREFRWGGWPVELRGLSEVEALKLISQRLRMLKIDRLVSDPALWRPLIATCGGNAKAIEIALGCLKYEGRSLQQVLDHLHEARGELFEDLFRRSWALLDEAAQNILLAMPFFPDGASSQALIATTGTEETAFGRSAEQLTDLTLLDIQHNDLNRPPRYNVHPLVRAFARARLSEAPARLEEALRQGWVGWYSELAQAVGYCWDDLKRLELLDPEQENVQAVLEWTLQNGRYRQTLELTGGLGYYYYIRGLWEKKPPINLIGVEAARQLSEPVQEAAALAYHVQLLCKQGNTSQAASWLPRLRQLAHTHQLPPDQLFMYRHSLALYAMLQGDYTEAREEWQSCLTLKDELSLHLWIANRQWLATGLYRGGQLAEATSLFQDALTDAVHYGYTQGQVAIQIHLAQIELEQGHLESAAHILTEGQATASYYQYRDHQAQIYYLYGRLHQKRGHKSAAWQALQAASDLFERLGMGYELAAARAELACLDTGLLAGMTCEQTSLMSGTLIANRLAQ